MDLDDLRTTFLLFEITIFGLFPLPIVGRKEIYPDAGAAETLLLRFLVIIGF